MKLISSLGESFDDASAISFEGKRTEPIKHLTMEPEDAVITALREAIDEPTLAKARALESALRRAGASSKVFGRLNQKASIDAAAESDRGITERIANAFDASVTAARRLSGMRVSDASLTPRNAAQRFLNPDRDTCDWRPVEKGVDFGKPSIQFWPEDDGVDLRYRKYKSPEGLVTVLVRDTALGISRTEDRCENSIGI